MGTTDVNSNFDRQSMIGCYPVKSQRHTKANIQRHCEHSEQLKFIAMDPIPVTIIAGTFACGKTTLCNQLLDSLNPEKRNVAVISHRFAEEHLKVFLL